MGPTGQKSSDARDDAALADEVLTASRALVAIAVRTITTAEVEVTVIQHRVLVLLAAHGNLQISAIAEALGFNQSNASRMCERLKRLGLVDRTRSQKDRRAVDVRLTPQGLRLVDSVTSARRGEIEAVLAQMPTADAQAVAAAFRSFNRAAHELADSDWMTAPW